MLTISSYFIFILIFFSENLVNSFRIFKIDGKETILAFENENINIQCESEFPMIYCGFVHPSGKRFSDNTLWDVTTRVIESLIGTSGNRFTDLSVNDGKCVKKMKATKADDGEWGCHIGRKSIRLETIKKIQVRIVNQVAAIEPNVTAKLNKPITIACATTKGLIPISYCRFEPPNGKSFNIDSSVTSENPILDKYYYPSNSSLDRGDCAVTISKVKYEDVGIWTCGASLDDGAEHVDVIKLEIEGMHAMSTASATGVTFGGILIAVALGSLGYIAWKKRHLITGAPNRSEDIEIHDMGERARQPPASPSPKPSRSVPSVVVQSPSEPGTSPLMPRTESSS